MAIGGYKGSVLNVMAATLPFGGFTGCDGGGVGSGSGESRPDTAFNNWIDEQEGQTLGDVVKDTNLSDVVDYMVDNDLNKTGAVTDEHREGIGWIDGLFDDLLNPKNTKSLSFETAPSNTSSIFYNDENFSVKVSYDNELGVLSYVASPSNPCDTIDMNFTTNSQEPDTYNIFHTSYEGTSGVDFEQISEGLDRTTIDIWTTFTNEKGQTSSKLIKIYQHVHHLDIMVQYK
jgi:hypothetical protein